MHCAKSAIQWGLLVIVTITMITTNISFSPAFSQDENLQAKINEIKNIKPDANQIFPVVNSTDKIVDNGTLKIGDNNINITYDRIGGIPYFESDIILPTEVVGGRAAIDKFIVNSPWSDAIVPVLIQSNLPNPERVIDAMVYLMQNTPVTFKPVTVENGVIKDPNYIRIAPHESACSSPIGMMDPSDPLFTGPLKLSDGRVVNGMYGDGKYHGQIINIADWCDASAISHEFGHALGLWHEQTRCDRDNFVDIMWSNIPKNLQHNFNVICDPNDPSKEALSPISYGDYDYCSIMHYPRNAVQSIDPSQPIIVPKAKVAGCEDIGTTKVYSQTDKDAISSIYSDLAK